MAALPDAIRSQSSDSPDSSETLKKYIEKPIRQLSGQSVFHGIEMNPKEWGIRALFPRLISEQIKIGMTKEEIKKVETYLNPEQKTDLIFFMQRFGQVMGGIGGNRPIGELNAKLPEWSKGYLAVIAQRIREHRGRNEFNTAVIETVVTAVGEKIGASRDTVRIVVDEAVRKDSKKPDVSPSPSASPSPSKLAGIKISAGVRGLHRGALLHEVDSIRFNLLEKDWDDLGKQKIFLSEHDLAKVIALGNAGANKTGPLSLDEKIMIAEAEKNVDKYFNRGFVDLHVREQLWAATEGRLREQPELLAKVRRSAFKYPVGQTDADEANTGAGSADAAPPSGSVTDRPMQRKSSNGAAVDGPHKGNDYRDLTPGKIREILIGHHFQSIRHLAIAMGDICQNAENKSSMQSTINSFYNGGPELLGKTTHKRIIEATRYELVVNGADDKKLDSVLESIGGIGGRMPQYPEIAKVEVFAAALKSLPSAKGSTPSKESKADTSTSPTTGGETSPVPPAPLNLPSPSDVSERPVKQTATQVVTGSNDAVVQRIGLSVELPGFIEKASTLLKSLDIPSDKTANLLNSKAERDRLVETIAVVSKSDEDFRAAKTILDRENVKGLLKGIESDAGNSAVLVAIDGLGRNPAPGIKQALTNVVITGTQVSEDEARKLEMPEVRDAMHRFMQASELTKWVKPEDAALARSILESPQRRAAVDLVFSMLDGLKPSSSVTAG